MRFCVKSKIRLRKPLIVSLAAIFGGLPVASAASFSQFLRQMDQGKVALLVAADCKPCQQQRELLKSCDAELKNKIVYVSLSSAMEWKKLRLHPPAGSAWSYLSKEQLHRWNVRGTPTFIFGDKAELGLKTCAELNYFLQKGA